MLSTNIATTLEEKEASKNIELDHEYEILDQYNRDQPTGEFQLIQCPAYIPVVQTNQTSTSHPSTATSDNDKDMELVTDMSVYDTPSST